jgi:hypothetical protein
VRDEKSIAWFPGYGEMLLDSANNNITWRDMISDTETWDPESTEDMGKLMHVDTVDSPKCLVVACFFENGFVWNKIVPGSDKLDISGGRYRGVKMSAPILLTHLDRKDRCVFGFRMSSGHLSVIECENRETDEEIHSTEFHDAMRQSMNYFERTARGEGTGSSEESSFSSSDEPQDEPQDPLPIGVRSLDSSLAPSDGSDSSSSSGSSSSSSSSGSSSSSSSSGSSSTSTYLTWSTLYNSHDGFPFQVRHTWTFDTVPNQKLKYIRILKDILVVMYGGCMQWRSLNEADSRVFFCKYPPKRFTSCCVDELKGTLCCIFGRDIWDICVSQTSNDTDNLPTFVKRPRHTLWKSVTHPWEFSIHCDRFGTLYVEECQVIDHIQYPVNARYYCDPKQWASVSIVFPCKSSFKGKATTFPLRPMSGAFTIRSKDTPEWSGHITTTSSKVIVTGKDARETNTIKMILDYPGCALTIEWTHNTAHGRYKVVAAHTRVGGDALKNQVWRVSPADGALTLFKEPSQRQFIDIKHLIENIPINISLPNISYKDGFFLNFGVNPQSGLDCVLDTIKQHMVSTLIWNFRLSRGKRDMTQCVIATLCADREGANRHTDDGGPTCGICFCALSQNGEEIQRICEHGHVVHSQCLQGHTKHAPYDVKNMCPMCKSPLLGGPKQFVKLS